MGVVTRAKRNERNDRNERIPAENEKRNGNRKGVVGPTVVLPMKAATIPVPTTTILPERIDGSEIENEEGGRSESTDRRQNADTNEAGKIRRLLAEDAGARRRTAAATATATISPGNDGNGERNDAVERKSPSRLAERANQAAGVTAKTPIGIPRATTKAKGVMTRGSTDAILHG